MQTLKGKIVSNKMKNTVTVEVSRLKKHRRYGKYMKISKKYKAHTEENLSEGIDVLIKSSKPISKDKRWVVAGVIK
ncbi:30S ribosomal protein S17 [Candidatus Giovannonibacteria bacterium]|nr:30S ribosomal protein S17 [Candidatus Giovannonibacteria bacterium]